MDKDEKKPASHLTYHFGMDKGAGKRQEPKIEMVSEHAPASGKMPRVTGNGTDR